MYRWVIFWLLAAVATSLPAQSPWTRSKAGLYTQAGYHFIPTYESLFAPDGGEQALERALSERTIQLYTEYGIGKNTTLVLSLPFRFLEAGDLTMPGVPPQTGSGTLSGLGNTQFSVRQKLIDGKLPLTASFKAELPVDRYDDITGMSLGYNAWTFTPMISTGKGYAATYWFAYVGYGYRTDDFSDLLNAGAEGGLHLGPVWAILFVDWVQPMRNGAVALPPRNNLTGLYVNNQGYVAVGFKAVAEINRFFGAFFSFGGAATAQQVPRSPGLGLGGYFKWD